MTEKEQRAIISRLHRISGQVAGIEKMVSEGAPEEEIIIQINAVNRQRTGWDRCCSIPR